MSEVDLLSNRVFFMVLHAQANSFDVSHQRFPLSCLKNTKHVTRAWAGSISLDTIEISIDRNIGQPTYITRIMMRGAIWWWGLMLTQGEGDGSLGGKVRGCLKGGRREEEVGREDCWPAVSCDGRRNQSMIRPPTHPTMHWTSSQNKRKIFLGLEFLWNLFISATCAATGTFYGVTVGCYYNYT